MTSLTTGKQPAVRIDRLLPDAAGDVTDEDLLRVYSTEVLPPADRPWVRMNFVTSVDGAAAVDGRSGALGTAADTRLFDLLRLPADVLLIGAGTLRIEQYGPVTLSTISRAWRQERGQTDQPVLAVVSGRLDLDPTAAVFVDAPVRPIVYTTESGSASARSFGSVADVVTVGEHNVNPLCLIDDLHRRGHHLIHSEGGPTLAGALLACDAIDELCLTLSPRFEAGPGGRIITHPLPLVRELRLAALHGSGSTLLARYLRPPPRPATHPDPHIAPPRRQELSTS